MPDVIREFRRSDRDHVADLVNAHISAVVPGAAVSVNAVLSQLEREPGDYVVDPWVDERRVLVVERADRVIGAALVHRFATSPHVPGDRRGAAEIRWLVYLPHGSAPEWSSTEDVGDRLVEACVTLMRHWGAAECLADGGLPSPGVYGVPDQWPHVRAAFVGAGFRPRSEEMVLVARVDGLPDPTASPPMPGVIEQRAVGRNGVRLSAVVDDRRLGFIEIDTTLDAPRRGPSALRWADVGNLEAVDRRPEILTWLLARARAWLEWGGVDRLLAYADVADLSEAVELTSRGFAELSRTARGWTLATP